MAERRRFDEVQRAFARHLRDPERAPPPDDVEPRRMKVYRELFHNNLASLLAGTYPVLHAIIGPERWAALVRDFMVRHQAHTPLFTEVPQELLRFLQETRRDAPGDPPFMLELAHYEWGELALHVASDAPAADGVDPHGDPAAVDHRHRHRPAAAVQRRRLRGRGLQRRDLQLPGAGPPSCRRSATAFTPRATPRSSSTPGSSGARPACNVSAACSPSRCGTAIARPCSSLATALA